MSRNWESSPLSKLLNVQNGYAFNSKKFNNSYGKPLIRIRDLKNGFETKTFYEGGYDDKFVVKSGDFLIGMDGNFSCQEWRGGDALLNQRVCRLQGFSDTLLPRFLFYGINKYLKDIEDVTTYTTVKHISSKRIKQICFPLPPLPEQKQIVSILDKAFEGIDKAIANTEKNLANARELFESYLNDVFTQKGEGWVDATLSEMALEFGRGKSKHRPRNAKFLYGGDYPFIQTGNIRNANHFITKFTQTYSEEGLKQSKLWPKGTVCITIAANIAETGIMTFEGCFPDSVIGMIPDPLKTTSEYVEYVLQLFRSELQKKGKGSAQDNINVGTFKEQTFPFAKLDQQKAIVKKLDALNVEKLRLSAIYQRKLEALNELKQSLLQKAFSGELTKDAA